MKFRKSVHAAVALSLFACAFNTPVYASSDSNKVDVVLQASILETIAVVVANPLIVFGTVTNGQNNTAPLDQALAIVTTWNLSPGRTVKMYAYFDTASAALTGTVTGDKIPASAMTASVNSGSFSSFSSASPYTAGPSAMTVYTSSVTASNAITIRTDALSLAINLTGLSQRSDLYAGLLHIQAQAV